MKAIMKYSIFGIVAVSILIGSAALADIDKTAHWPVEVTSNYNAVYGELSGIDAQPGDSVGMFDSKGNCYGAGFFDGAHYYISAFMYEEPNPAVPADVAIPGFSEGDAVIFKIYRESTGQEYEVSPASGAYTYRYQGIDPPTKIDLAYNSGGQDGPGQGQEQAGDGGDPSGEGAEWATGLASLPIEAGRKAEEKESVQAGEAFSSALPEKEQAYAERKSSAPGFTLEAEADAEKYPSQYDPKKEAGVFAIEGIEETLSKEKTGREEEKLQNRTASTKTPPSAKTPITKTYPFIILGVILVYLLLVIIKKINLLP